MGKRSLLALTISLTMLALPGAPDAQAGPALDPRFGAVEAFRAPDHARELGIGWQRILFWWNALQPNSPNDWNEDYLPNGIVQSGLEDGRSIVGCLVTTPKWANGTGRPFDPPQNLYLPYDHPDNYWGQFVKKIVSKYKGRIDHWIVWNEPDVWDSANPGYTWSGSVADYYQLLKVAYQAAKATNPDSKVLLAGLTYWWDEEYNREQYFKRLLDVAEKDPTASANNWYFDIAVLQLYNDPRMLYDVPLTYRRIMREHGIDKPIWINETNVTPWDDPAAPLPRERFRATLDEQASYIVQALSYALAAGVERVAIYKMRDQPGLRAGDEAFGLVRSDGTTRPAYTAFQVATTYFAGVKQASAGFQGDTVNITMDKENERLTVVWTQSPEPQTARIRAIASEAVLVNKYGRTERIASQEGYYVLNLAGATHNTVPGDSKRYQIGGSPLIVVEEKGRGGPAPESLPGTNRENVWVSPETGYAVSGEWLEFFKARGGLDIFGQPVSEVVADPTMGGQTVQFFQRAVLEWHPENPPEYRILRRLLGDVFYPGADPPVATVASVDQRFSASGMYRGLGHDVYDIAPDGTPIYFRQFFDAYGGLSTFGYPKEEPKVRNGRWTQRFQAAVFEHHPENDRDGYIPGTNVPYRNYRVQLELLGEKYVALKGLAFGR